MKTILNINSYRENEFLTAKEELIDSLMIYREHIIYSCPHKNSLRSNYICIILYL